MTSIKQLFAPRDMAEGLPWKRIIEFSIPMLIGNIAQQLYSTVDSIVVGIYVGDNALAAVGSAMPVLNILLVLFVGVSSGAGIKVSQYFGAKDRARLSHTIGNCLFLTIFITIVILIVGPLVSRPLLRLVNTPESIIDWSASYLNIFFFGGIGFIFYNMMAGILRGLGDSFSALAFLLVATILNVVLDIWFVAGFGMGVPGVALATVISQFVSAVFCFIKLMKMRDILDISMGYLKPKKEYILQILKLGLPSGVTQGIFAAAQLLVQSLTNSFGETLIACNVIIMRIDGFAMMPNFTFGMAMTTFTGQNVGARRIDRIATGTKQGVLIASGTAATLTLLILLFGRSLISVFTTTQSLIDMSVNMIRILAAGYIAMGITNVYSGVMRGAGDTVTPMWISIITTVILRIPIAYGLAFLTRSAEYPVGRPESLFISLLVSWVLGAAITALLYKRGKWRKKTESMFREQQPAA